MAKKMPVQGCPSIPWHIIAPHDEQARKNHDQTLERLRQRGGLDAVEARLIIEGVPLRDHRKYDLDECKAWVRDLVKNDEVGALRAQVDTVTAERDALAKQYVDARAAHGYEQKRADGAEAERDAALAREAALRDAARAVSVSLSGALFDGLPCAGLGSMRAALDDSHASAAAYTERVCDLYASRRVLRESHDQMKAAVLARLNMKGGGDE